MGITDLPLRLVEAFTGNGWGWSGAWANTKNVMHFEYKAFINHIAR